MRKIVILLISLIIISCSNKELDRNLASELIKKHYDYPQVEIIRFDGITSSQKLNNEYKELRANKFIDSKQKGKYGNEFRVSIEPNGVPYYYSGTSGSNGYVVASNLIELSEVTGIRFNENKSIAYVDYTTKRSKVNLFGKSEGYKDGDLKDETTTLQLYDDGWRVTSEKRTYFTTSDFPMLYERKKFDEFFNEFDTYITKKEKSKLSELFENELVNISTQTKNKIGKKQLLDNEKLYKLKFDKPNFIGATETARDKFGLKFDKGTRLFVKTGTSNNDETYYQVSIFFKSNRDGISAIGYYEEQGMKENSTNVDNEGLSYVYISVDDLRVRDRPSLDAETIEKLKKWESVGFYNQKSSDKISVTIKGKEINDYWYKIKTPSGKIGWIHGCCFTYE